MVNTEQCLISDECLMIIHKHIVFWKLHGFVLGKQYTDSCQICYGILKKCKTLWEGCQLHINSEKIKQQSRNINREETGPALKTTLHILNSVELIRGPKSARLWRKCYWELTYSYTFVSVQYVSKWAAGGAPHPEDSHKWNTPHEQNL